MKNLKRLLCLVLSTVMLLGMTVVGVGAVDFADSDQIVNTEAVEITAGLGLFAGTDGKFNPNDTVTRAQMATIIVKMLRGSDFNADAFKGVDKFPDTASFEGGWAEGYINACVQMGVVAGYPDGTYRPGKELTTAEAVTMIINALKVDAGEGTWPLTVMSKAEQIKLFAELSTKPGTNDALSRDSLASVVLQGLNFSPSNSNAYKVSGVNVTFSTYNEALSVALNKDLTANDIVEIPGVDTLAKQTFSMQTASGIVTDNQAFGAKYTKLNADSTEYDVETGLDMIGHRVTIYYKNVEKDSRKQVYCVIDECETVTVDKAINSTNDYKAAFGKNKDLAPAAELTVLDSDYTKLTATTVTGYIAGSKAPAGTYVLYEDKIITYVKSPVVCASYVADIVTGTENDRIWLAGLEKVLYNADGNDLVTEYPGIALKDYVTYTVARGNYVLKTVDPVSGKITKTNKNSDGVDVVTLGGRDYEYFDGNPLISGDHNNSGLTHDISKVDFDTRYILYITEDDKYVGFEPSDGGVANISDVLYLLGSYSVEKQDAFGSKSRKYFAQGVDAAGVEFNYPLSVEYDTNKDGIYGGTGDDATVGTITTLGEGWYTGKASTATKEKDVGIWKFTKIGNTYDESTNPLFCGANSQTVDEDDDGNALSTFSFTKGAVLKSIHLCTSACTAAKHISGSTTTAYFNSTKFLFIDGALGSSLTTSVVPKSSIAFSSSSGVNFGEFNYLLSKGSGGATNIDLVVIKRDPDEASSSSYTIYVSEDQRKPISRTADGYLYQVYVYSTGAIKELTMASANAFAKPGFYQYKTDGDGIAAVSNDSVTPTSSNRIVLGHVLLSVSNNYLTTNRVAGAPSIVWSTRAKSTASAKVFDVRTEDEIERSEIPEVTSTAQLFSLATTSHKFVTMDIVGSSSSAIGVIYVTGIYTAPPALTPETVYLSSAPAARSVNTVKTVDGVTKDIYISTASSLTGWVDYYLDSNYNAVVKPNTSAINKSVSKSMLSGNTLTISGYAPMDLSSTTMTDTSGYGITNVTDLSNTLNIIGVDSVACSILLNSTGGVVDFSVTGVSGGKAQITGGMLTGSTLTYGTASYDLSGATFNDQTGNGIDSLANLTTALNATGVNYLACNVKLNAGLTAADEVTIFKADVDSNLPAVVPGWDLSSGRYYYSPAGLPAPGYGAGSGELWLLSTGSTATTVKVQRVTTSWDSTYCASAGQSQFYHYVNSSARPNGLFGFSNEKHAYTSYRFGLHDVVTDVSLSGSTYTMTTANLKGHGSHTIYSDSGSASSMSCTNGYEAPKTVTFTAGIPIYDLRENVIDGLTRISTVDDLITHVNNGEQILIDYFCVRGDSTPDEPPTTATCNVIFICADQ